MLPVKKKLWVSTQSKKQTNKKKAPPPKKKKKKNNFFVQNIVSSVYLSDVYL